MSVSSISSVSSSSVLQQLEAMYQKMESKNATSTTSTASPTTATTTDTDGVSGIGKLLSSLQDLATSDPAKNIPSQCWLVAKYENGLWHRFGPDPKSGFVCKPAGIVPANYPGISRS